MNQNHGVFLLQQPILSKALHLRVGCCDGLPIHVGMLTGAGYAGLV